MEQNQQAAEQAAPATEQPAAEQQAQAPQLPKVFVVMAPGKQDTPVVQITGQGQFLWHKEAAQMIADDSLWPEQYTGIRFLLQVAFNIEFEPLDAKQAFSELQLLIPSGLPEGSPEYETELRFQIFKKGISYGKRYLLELNGPEFQRLAPTFNTLLTLLHGVYEAKTNSAEISEEAWSTLATVAKEAYVLLPTLARLGVECHHQLLPVVDSANGDKVVGFACVNCGQPFDMAQTPPPPQAPETVAAPDLSAVVGQAPATEAPTEALKPEETVQAATETSVETPADPGPTTEG
jgi:hypothetical protein